MTKFLMAIALVISVVYLNTESSKKLIGINHSVKSDKSQMKKNSNLVNLVQRSEPSSIIHKDEEQLLEFPTIGDSIYENLQYQQESELGKAIMASENEVTPELVVEDNDFDEYRYRTESERIVRERAESKFDDEMIALEKLEYDQENSVGIQPWKNNYNNSLENNENNHGSISRAPAVLGEPEFDDEIQDVRNNAQENGFDF